MKCPFCEAANPQLISLFGSQLLFSHYRCRACGTYFEGLREDREENTAPNHGLARPCSESASLQGSFFSSSEPKTRSPDV